MGLFGNKQPQLDQAQLAQLQKSQEQREADIIYRQGIVTMRDLIAPPSIEIESGYVRETGTVRNPDIVYAVRIVGRNQQLLLIAWRKIHGL